MKHPETGTFGYRLRAARQERGLSQAQLGAIVGIGQGLIAKYENNIVFPTVSTLEWLCTALCIKSSDLLGF